MRPNSPAGNKKSYVGRVAIIGPPLSTRTTITADRKGLNLAASVNQGPRNAPKLLNMRDFLS